MCRVAALPCVAERTLTMFALQHTGCLQQLKTITGLSGAWYGCQWPVLAPNGWEGIEYLPGNSHTAKALE